MSLVLASSSSAASSSSGLKVSISFSSFSSLFIWILPLEYDSSCSNSRESSSRSSMRENVGWCVSMLFSPLVSVNSPTQVTSYVRGSILAYFSLSNTLSDIHSWISSGALSSFSFSVSLYLSLRCGNFSSYNFWSGIFVSLADFLRFLITVLYFLEFLPS